MSTLHNKSVWTPSNEMGKFEKLGREAFVEIIIASSFEAEISHEGLPIFVLKTAIRSEYLYFQHIVYFLRSFFEKIKICELPLHVSSFLKLIEEYTEIDRIDEDSDPRYNEFDGGSSPDKSSSHTDTSSTSSSLSALNACGHRPLSNSSKRSHNLRKILIYSPTELRKFDKIHLKSEKLILSPYERFLANLRRAGMDILFPRENHDALLSFIYAFLKGAELSTKTFIIDHREEEKRSRRSETIIKIPYETADNDYESGDDLQIPILRIGEVHALTHKEMIDTVIYYQKRNDDFGGVTKTKTRGVLALLKHAAAIDSFTPIDDCVQITLNASVHDFRDIRVLHDRYLVAAAKEYDVELTQEEWRTLVWENWEVDPCLASCVDRVQEMSSYLSTLSPSIFQELADESAANAVEDASYSSNEKRCNEVELDQLSNSSFSENVTTVKTGSLEHKLELDPTILFPASPCATIDSQLTESPGFFQSESNITNFVVHEGCALDLVDAEILSEAGGWEDAGVENYSTLLPKSLSADSLGSLILSTVPLNTRACAYEENEDPRVVGSPISFKGKFNALTTLEKRGSGLGALSDFNVQSHLNIGQSSPKLDAEGNLLTEDDDRL